MIFNSPIFGEGLFMPLLGLGVFVIYKILNIKEKEKKIS